MNVLLLDTAVTWLYTAATGLGIAATTVWLLRAALRLTSEGRS